MTRRFLYGRTETIRACSLESVNFARIMMEPSSKDGEKIAALRLAMNSHRDYVIKVYLISLDIM
jgi:carnitine O-acetyltransferase